MKIIPQLYISVTRSRPAEDFDEIQPAPGGEIAAHLVNPDEVSIDVSEVSEDYKNYEDTLLSLTKLILIEKRDGRNKHVNDYYKIIQQEAEGILNHSYPIPPSNSTRKTVKNIFDQLTKIPYCDEEIISKFIEKFKYCLGNSGSTTPYKISHVLIDLVIKYDNAIRHLDNYLKSNPDGNSKEALAKTFNYYLDTQYKDAPSKKETNVYRIGYGFGISLLGLGFPLLAASAQSGLGAMSPAICAGLGAISVMGSAATLVTTNRLARKERKNTYRKVSFEEPKTIEEVIEKINKTIIDIESPNQTERSTTLMKPLNDEIEKLKKIITKQNTLKESMALSNVIGLNDGGVQSSTLETSFLSDRSEDTGPPIGVGGSTIHPQSLTFFPPNEQPLSSGNHDDETIASVNSVEVDRNADDSEQQGRPLHLASLPSTLDSPRTRGHSSPAAASHEVGASHGAISSAHSRTVTPEGSPASSQRSSPRDESQPDTPEESPTSYQRSSRAASPVPETSSEGGEGGASQDIDRRERPSSPSPYSALETPAPAPAQAQAQPQARERSDSPSRN